MADKPKPAGDIDLEKEMRDAIGRIAEYEKTIQSGEADEDEVEGTKRRIRNEQAKRLLRTRGDVQQVVRLPEGRRMLYRILEIAGPNRLSPNISDPYVTAESNGMRKIALEILGMLYDADPNVYSQMQREHVSDMKAELERKTKEMEELKS